MVSELQNRLACYGRRQALFTAYASKYKYVYCTVTVILPCSFAVAAQDASNVTITFANGVSWELQCGLECPYSHARTTVMNVRGISGWLHVELTKLMV